MRLSNSVSASIWEAWFDFAHTLQPQQNPKSLFQSTNNKNPLAIMDSK